MKKTKIIALVLAVSIMLMGAGYAYWSDTLVINNTVSTGELRVEFVKQDFKLCPPQLKYPDSAITDGTNKLYATADIKQDSVKKTTLKVNNMYPGVWALYDAKFENKGTIPAVIQNVKVTTKKNSDALNKNLIVFGGYVHHYNGSKLPSGKVFLCTLNNFEATINNLMKGIRLEKGEYITLDIPTDKRGELNSLIAPYGIKLMEEENCINFLLPTTVTNADGAELQTAEFDLEFNFTQHNAVLN